MEYTELGETDLTISRVALGLWNIVDDLNWDGVHEERAIKTIHTAVDEGVTFFDTAEAYGDGYSEEVLGKALESVDREDLVIASKVQPDNLAYEDLKEACEESLDRLGLDTIDVYYVHWPNHNIPFEETARALRELEMDGKIGVPAVSNFGPGDLESILNECRVEANQLPYNLLWRAIEYEITDDCRENGVDIVCYSPLAQGLLAGKYDTPDEVPVGRARTRHFASNRPNTRHGEEGAEEETFETIDRFEGLCNRYDVGYSEAAIAWLLRRNGVASVVVGATDPNHVQANARVPDMDIPKELLDELDEVTAGLKETLGSNPDTHQSNSRYR